ncbi:MAG: Coproporphyrinogen oxidase [Gammaproteobacteria bacterium]|nr:Coproporphyrinogen oxidase [Gammaproteobacteria bacterium]
MPNIIIVKDYLLALHKKLCDVIEAIDGADTKFFYDHWSSDKGSGVTCALKNGEHIENCGVNFSHVFGQQLPPAASSRHPELVGRPFEVVGLSLIIHPKNPYVPTSHFNLRFFLSSLTDGTPIWWFGGGYDMTPYYGFEEDCKHFHETAKKACDPFDENLYPMFKKAADEYFYIKHRKEPRGIGGIFFDDMHAWDFDRTFEFAKSVGNSFILAYTRILVRRMHTPYTQKERDFQLYRRGRYVEFNLVYDRGTLFGLQFGGRIESILISLPANVRWEYDWRPQSGSPEEKLYEHFLVPRDWADYESPEGQPNKA